MLRHSIKMRLDIILKNFLREIADHYKLDYDELLNFVDSIDDKGVQQNMATCAYVISRGVNKGQHCPKKALDNGYCGKHYNQATTTANKLAAKKAVDKPKMTKTQQQIIEWLNTATPKEETVLKKRSKGLVHEGTDLVFNEEFMVIGRLNKDGINKLSHFEVELCEKHGWCYDETMIESEESEESE